MIFKVIGVVLAICLLAMFSGSGLNGSTVFIGCCILLSGFMAGGDND